MYSSVRVLLSLTLIDNRRFQILQPRTDVLTAQTSNQTANLKPLPDFSQSPVSQQEAHGGVVPELLR